MRTDNLKDWGITLKASKLELLASIGSPEIEDNEPETDIKYQWYVLFGVDFKIGSVRNRLVKTKILNNEIIEWDILTAEPYDALLCKDSLTELILKLKMEIK